MWKKNKKRYSKEQLKAKEKEEIEKKNDAFRWINYIFILVLFNLLWDWIFFWIDKIWWLEWTHISYVVLKCSVKIVIPLLLALCLEIFHERIRQWFEKFIYNLLLFIGLFIMIIVIYYLTNK